PNGHKLHVKNELAGRRGICPDCGAKVEIPSLDGSPAEVDSTAPEPTSTTAASASPAVNALEGDSDAASPAAMVAVQPPSDEPLWYVRPHQGGQYGPATTEVVLQWQREGRVTSDSWVWRTGWPEWRSGAEALPSLETPPSPPVIAASAIDSLSSGELSLGGTMASAPMEFSATSDASPGGMQDRQQLQRAKKRRRRNVTMFMTLLVMILAAIFVVVLVSR
ncbi:MAG: DUF4339 domain-containing protein, partial [Planctomycetales bacterium]|nr:DUF4339 domain-containing protein [Planctomycetales bacterium]